MPYTALRCTATADVEVGCSVFINRVAELDALQMAVAEAPSLAVVTGRRRVGKSALLTQMVADRLVYFQADQRSVVVQLREFAGAAAAQFNEDPLAAALLGSVASSWPQVLEALATVAVSGSGPLCVVLDEFQYLAESEPALPSILQRAWDRWQRESVPICLVLCGSAVSFMEGLLDAASPLFGRAGLRMKLEPLAYRECRGFAPRLSPGDHMERFGLLGGVAQYQVWAGTDDADSLVSDRLLNPLGPFWNEPQHLLRAEDGIRDPARYLSILQAVGHGNTRVNLIAQAAGVEVSSVSKALGYLHELGYVLNERPAPVHSGDKSRSQWRLADQLARWWFVTGAERSLVTLGRHDRALASAKEKVRHLVGQTFEEVARSWTARSVEKVDSVGRWWSRDGQVEIDLVGMDGRGVAVLGSCKWTRRLFGEHELDGLLAGRAHLGPVASNAQLFCFSRSGFSAGLRRRVDSMDEPVELVDLDRLYSEGGLISL